MLWEKSSPYAFYRFIGVPWISAYRSINLPKRVNGTTSHGKLIESEHYLDPAAEVVVYNVIIYGMYDHTYSKGMDEPGKDGHGQLNRKNEYFPVRVVRA